MEFSAIVLLAIGLSFDSFAVSVSSGLIKKEIQFFQAVRIALILAIFQGGFPLIGWFLGSKVKELIEPWDYWIAFLLLTVLGAKMVYEAFQSKEEREFNPLHLQTMVGMAVATSIDALIVGVSFAIYNLNLSVTVITIGSVTFVASMLGILLGKKAVGVLGNRMEILGGLILFIIGLKILLEHVIA
ncbi:MAG TPA: manganese efflux pump MntP family protein [Williamwhitmania sp.]|nr:manganese efflux pump MntP family protein [Williamwhitmania sp.]